MPISKDEQQEVGEHVIFGDWSATDDDQFMIYYHPGGRYCTVFLFTGFDYGGGISKFFEDTNANIDPIIDAFDTAGDAKQALIKYALSLTKDK